MNRNIIAEIAEWNAKECIESSDSVVEVTAADSGKIELRVPVFSQGDEVTQVYVTFRLPDLIAAVITYMPTK